MSVTLHKLQIKKFKGFTKLEPDTKIITMDFLSSATEVVAIFGELWDFVKFICENLFIKLGLIFKFGNFID